MAGSDGVVAMEPVVAVGVVGAGCWVHAGRVFRSIANSVSNSVGDRGHSAIITSTIRPAGTDGMVSNDSVVAEREVGTLSWVHSSGVFCATSSRDLPKKKEE